MILNFFAVDNKNKYLQQTTHIQTKAYNSILFQYKDLSEVIYTGLLRFTKVDEKLFNISKKSKIEQAQIRQKLYLQTINRFNTLKKRNIISINYILPDNTVFLKMINPLDYGNKVSDKRETLKYVQEHKVPISSYEIGKFGSGYRFVYPIIKNNIYLGLISLTFSEEAITESLMKQYDVLSNFIIKKENFDEDYLKNSNIYKDAHFSGFVHNKNILEDLKNESKKKIVDMKPSYEVSKKLYELGQQTKSSSIFVNEKDSIVTIIPIYHTISKKYEGFISIISKGETINLLNNNYYTILFLFIFLYLSVMLLFLQQKIKTILDKELTQEIIKKDQQLLEQAKMAQMGEMIGNIAHQWRQPLSAISTIASGLKLNYEFGMLQEDDIPKNMDLIVDNTKYLSKTIDTFRDFIKEKRVEKEVIIQDRIEESLKIIQASLENNHIKLIKNIDYQTPVKYRMIPEELAQVIINILNNAKDAIIHKKIKDGWIKISLIIKDNKILITIEDNAKGIDEENLIKIFDPYFTTKHQSQGTGLGLYMSKTIIEKHLGGKLIVENSENGAVFTIELHKKD
ncbi:sensor histidine kinase [Campylobacterota bacterium DY0563]